MTNVYDATLAPPPPLAEPVYRFDRTFEQNAASGPAFAGPYPDVPATPSKDFLGHRVASRLGIAASLLVNERWVALYSRLGFDLLTYKTVRSRPRIAHPVPNWVYVDETSLVSDPGTPVRTIDSVPLHALTATAAGSIGIPSSPPEFWRADIAKCRAHLRPGQVLIVSVVGTAEAVSTEAALVDDFATLAGEVRAAGAQVVELNLSCPNVAQQEGEVYRDVAMVGRIARAARAAIGSTPLLVKIGPILEHAVMAGLLRELAGIVDGVVMINAPSRLFVDPSGAPTFGASRLRAGLMGGVVFDVAMDCVRRAVTIVREDGLALRILAVGGVCSPVRVRALFDAGAYAVMAASAAAWDPYLAIRTKLQDPAV